MLLPVGQVITFKGRDGAIRAAEFERELCGRGERIGNAVHVKHRTHLKPSFAAVDVEPFSFRDSAREYGMNGHPEAVRA